ANVIWGARIQENYKGKVRVMAIMTGVQSAQVLGPSTQKQADKSRQELQEVDSKQRATEETAGSTTEFGAHSDGGKEEVEQNNGLDVIR
ncbi:MAG: cell division protein FtsZ, partial [Halobacterium sp.]